MYFIIFMKCPLRESKKSNDSAQMETYDLGIHHTVHSLNLVMQQIGTQIDWVKQIYQEGEEIQMFVTNHISQSIFKSFSKLESLKVDLKL